MWLSKKKYNEMMERIKKLEDCHHKSINPFDDTQKDYYFKHDSIPFQIKTNTEKIKNITFQELASYIIDNKPIERKENIEVTKKYY